MSYRERLWLTPWISLLFLALIGILSVIIAIQIGMGIPVGDRPAPSELLFGFDILFILLYLNFYSLRIEVDPNKISVAYGVIRKTIPIMEIASCETILAGFWTYGGMGMRLGSDGSLAFTTSFGKAVKIVRKTGRPFVFSTKRPDEVTNLIKILLKKERD